MAQRERKLTVEYYVPAKERNVQVCKEAFIGILRVKKSRVNALLKSFYKIDVSKDNSQDEQISSKLQETSKERGRTKINDNIELETNTKTLTNIDHSTQSNCSFEYEDYQPECEPHDKITSCSISQMETKVLEEGPMNNENETKSDLEDNFSNILNLDSEARKQSPSNRPVNDELLDTSQQKSNSAQSHPISRHSSGSYTNQNICQETATESTEQTTNNPRISLPNQLYVYESNKRRLRKHERMDGKENIRQKFIKERSIINNRNIRQVTNKIEKHPFLKRKVNKFGQTTRFPLRTLC